MRITGFDHVTIRVRPCEVEAMRAFYADLLELVVGPRVLSFPGVWLYLGSTSNEQAVVHVAGNIGKAAYAAAAQDAPGFDQCSAILQVTPSLLPQSLDTLVARSTSPDSCHQILYAP